MLGQGINRRTIGIEIALGIGFRPRRLTQHIVGMTHAFTFIRLGTLQRLGQCRAHDELSAHDPHGLQHRPANNRLAEPCDHAIEYRPLILIGMIRPQHPATEHQRPGRGIDEQPARFLTDPFPGAGPELVLDQLVRGIGIGDAQQCLGEAHQRDTLAG